MNEERAREILGPQIWSDDSLDLGKDGYWIPHNYKAKLAGWYDADKLEAIAWWMRNRKAT